MEAVRHGQPALVFALGHHAGRRACCSAAARGELATPQASRKRRGACLPDPRAHQALDEFVSQWLRFDRVLTGSRDRRTLPASSRRETGRRHDRGSAAVRRRPGLERPQLHGCVHGQLRLRERRSGGRSTACRRPPGISTAWSFPAESERAGLLGQALFLALASQAGRHLAHRRAASSCASSSSASTCRRRRPA